MGTCFEKATTENIQRCKINREVMKKHARPKKGNVVILPGLLKTEVLQSVVKYADSHFHCIGEKARNYESVFYTQ